MCSVCCLLNACADITCPAFKVSAILVVTDGSEDGDIYYLKQEEMAAEADQKLHSIF